MRRSLTTLPHRLLAAFTAMLLASCVNTINDSLSDDDDTVGASIKITSYDLHSQVYDVDNAHEEGVGVYVVLSSSSLNKSRYLSNEKYVMVGGGFKDVDGNAFYPGSSKCNIFSYYPYQEGGIAEKSYDISVGVKADQTDISDYNQSDFMTAQSDELASTDNEIDLDYKHRFTRISFVINVIDDTDPAELLAANPSIYISELYTAAQYDISTGEFTNYSAMESIIPNGEWSLLGNSLVGKRAIIVPQTVDSKRNMLYLTIGESVYRMSLEDEYRFTSGRELTLTVDFAQTDSGYGLKCTMGCWNTGGSMSATLEMLSDYGGISVSSIDFDTIPVYNVVNGSKKIWQICRELLYNSDIKCQAIVAYPYRDGEVDLTDGTVLRLVGQEGEVHGGKVAWNLTDNTFTYTPGTESAFNLVYFTKEGTLTTTSPEVYFPVVVEADRLVDLRSDVTTYYNIVKIATQYWLKENLSAIFYTDGKSITKRSSTTASTAAGYYGSGGNIFYNQNAVVSDKLAPVDCRIANYSDWSALKAYLHKDAYLLKATGVWYDSSNDMSGFSMQPCGAFVDSSGVASYSLSGSGTIFWVMDFQPTQLWSSALKFTVDSDSWTDVAFTSLYGCSVRCLKR